MRLKTTSPILIGKWALHLSDSGRWQAWLPGFGGIRGYGRTQEVAISDCQTELKKRGLEFLLEEPNDC